MMHDALDSDALFLDLYQLTMAQVYLASGQTGEATFSLYFRNFPPNRSYYVFCGLESALDYLQRVSFSTSDLEVLDRMDMFDDALLDHLAAFRFNGSVRAMSEGEVFFPNEPVMEVTGPIVECQIVETFLINQINVESMMATKAARVVEAAKGRAVVDFAARRTHGLDASYRFARASYIAGFQGTSNVAAAARYGIPAVGTMAHSFISSSPSEIEAFRAYARLFPDSSTFLVDTYDTLEGVRNAIVVAREMASRGAALRAVRLDSGDLGVLARQTRKLLDEADLPDVGIIGSSGLDEYSVEELVESGAPFDGFGVGTRVGSSSDAPFTDFVYKLVEYDREPIVKFSTDKETLPGAKQVLRKLGDDGLMRRDVIASADARESRSDSRTLLTEALEGGRFVRKMPSIDQIRDYHADAIQSLPPGLRFVRPTEHYDVDISPELIRAARLFRRR